MGEVPAVRCPLRFSAADVGSNLAPPALGQDTGAVLADVLRLDAAAIARLRDVGAVG
jgi:crotonobetainyl-CoA:carnitine CoA-transferase CaiB-like acyl-CoA transferase